MVEDLLDQLNILEANFTIVDEAVPQISPATRVSQNIMICMQLNVCIQNMSTYTHPQAMINAIFMQHFASLRLHH